MEGCAEMAVLLFCRGICRNGGCGSPGAFGTAEGRTRSPERADCRPAQARWYAGEEETGTKRCAMDREGQFTGDWPWICREGCLWIPAALLQKGGISISPIGQCRSSDWGARCPCGEPRPFSVTLGQGTANLVPGAEPDLPQGWPGATCPGRKRLVCLQGALGELL